MPSIKKALSLLLLLALSTGQAASRAAEYLYRYIDDQGMTVINYSIPPQFVHKGYEILNRDGSVHKVVPRSLTDEEMADRSSKAYQDRVAADESERLRKWDESLLLRYSSIEDIEAARTRSLSELRIRINILRSNVRSLKNQVESNQSRAADIERSGGSVPVELVAAIGGLQSEIAETDRSIQERLREIEVVGQGFQRDIDRFALLLDKVELRKRYSRTPD